MEKLNNTRIIRIDGSTIFYNKRNNQKLVIKNFDDKFHKDFADILPPNLDLYYLKSLNLFKRKKLKKCVEPLYFSYDFINVTFKYPLYMDDNYIQIFPKNKSEVKHKIDINEIRKDLYLTGFKINNIEYVRYKRSSGAAKEGSCLFIRKDLYKIMNEWSKTGLSEEKDLCFKSLTSYEAYKALSLSSITDILDISPRNILFVKDVEIILKNQKVVKVDYIDDKKLKAEEDVVDVKNNIFDGEGLLDSSVFQKIGKENKGMALLRARFFKCCAFNTNLQKWFKDNNITNLSQLNGITFAKDISEVLFVASESCLKYLKMCKGGFNLNNIERWINQIEKDEVKFGIVKHEKPSRFYYGEMVETTYQLLNSLQLKEKDVKLLVKNSLEYINYLRDTKNTPEFVRFYLENETCDFTDFEIEDDTEDSNNKFISSEIRKYSNFTFKYKVCLELLKVDSNILYTKMLKSFIYDTLIDALKLKLYNGKILVNGTYATLFGNPYEFLKYIVLDEEKKSLFDVNNPMSILAENEICSSFFNEGEVIVGSRAPHTTMGNVLVAKNRKLNEIDEYFNLTREIVVVDAIKNNIQHRLSGCDYDSDAMLITNNEILVNAAESNYNKFLVPYTGFKPKLKDMIKFSNNKKENLLLNLYDIDTQISTNIVGQIVNLSQLLNSHLWNGYKYGKDKSYKDLYNEICKLAVLSGTEIDSAKRSFPFKTLNEFNKVKKYSKEEGLIKNKPLFFAIVNKENGKKAKISDIEKTKQFGRVFKTSMDYLFNIIHDFKCTYSPRIDNKSLFDLLSDDYSINKVSGSLYEQKGKVIKLLNSIAEEIKSFRNEYDYDEYELKTENFNILIQGAYTHIKNNIDDLNKIKFIIKNIENTEHGYSTMFILLYILSMYQKDLNYTLKSLVSKKAFPAPTLVRTKSSKRYDYKLYENYFFCKKSYVK